ncbi:MAG TPA: hypothetical protein VGN06_06980, partial [Gaiellaceae bacterium]
NASVQAEWAGANVGLVLWKPATIHIAKSPPTLIAAESVKTGAAQSLSFTAPGRGWYYLEVKAASPGFAPYALSITKTGSPAAPRR